MVLAVLTAVVVAAVLATLAGAKRTASALDRFMDATAARDLQVVVNSADLTLDPARVDELRQRLAAMDGVDDVADDDDHAHRRDRYAVRLRGHGQS